MVSGPGRSAKDVFAARMASQVPQGRGLGGGCEVSACQKQDCCLVIGGPGLLLIG